MKGSKLKCQSGRSMIEMIAVLAIIGILTYTGIRVFRYMISQSEANHIHEDVMTEAAMYMNRGTARDRRKSIADTSLARTKTTTGNNFKTVQKCPPEQAAFGGETTTFSIKVDGIEKETCEQLMMKKWTKFEGHVAFYYAEEFDTLCPGDESAFHSGSSGKFVSLSNVADCAELNVKKGTFVAAFGRNSRSRYTYRSCGKCYECETCDSATNMCIPKTDEGACRGDEVCTEQGCRCPNGQHLNEEGYCVSGCIADADCLDKTLPMCGTNGKCYCPAGMVCGEEKQECKCGYTWNEEEHKCVAVEGELNCCPEGQYLNSENQCVSCLGNYDTIKIGACDRNEPICNAGTCETCSSGYYNRATHTCTGCLFGYVESELGNGACPESAPVCSDESYQCITCFEKNPNEPYWDGVTCTTCPDGTYFDNNTHECVNCATDGSAICPSCPNEMPFWDGNDCRECLNNYGNSAGACSDPQKPVCNSDHKCEECPAANKDGTCVECVKSYMAGEGACGSVRPFCNASNQCEVCASGEYNVTTFECCPVGTYYNDAGGCVSCLSSYGSGGKGTCPSSTPICNAGTCEACASGEYNTKTLTCCPSGKYYGGGDTCVDCLANYGSGQTGACPTTSLPNCVNGTCSQCTSDAPYYHEGICTTCSAVDNTKPFWDGNECRECLANYKAGEGACGSSKPICDSYQCQACPNFYDEQKHICVDCLADYGTGQTGACPTTASPVCPESGVCSPCVTDGSATCPACTDSSKPYWNGSDCVECLVNNGVGDGDCPETAPICSSGTCTTCAAVDNTKPFWNNGVCVACTENSGGGEGSCPAETPVCSSGVCTTCAAVNSKKPNWNSSTRQCVAACTNGKVWKPAKNVCECQDGFAWGNFARFQNKGCVKNFWVSYSGCSVGTSLPENSSTGSNYTYTYNLPNGTYKFYADKYGRDTCSTGSSARGCRGGDGDTSVGVLYKSGNRTYRVDELCGDEIKIIDGKVKFFSNNSACDSDHNRCIWKMSIMRVK